MNFLQQYDIFFFDFDGLLVNTEQLHYQAYKALIENHDFEMHWNFHDFALIAHTSSDGLKRAICEKYPPLNQFPWEALYREKKQLYEALLTSQKLNFMDGAEEVLDLVQDKRHLVVTNSTKAQIDVIKESLPRLKKIPTFITREDYLNPKPSPDGYLKAIELFGQKSDRMIGFEDAMRGIKSLQGANIHPVLICSSDHPQLSSPDAKGLDQFNTFHHFLDSSYQNL